MADETKPPAPAAAPPKPAGPPPPPPPKNPGMVTCTVDGREVVVKPGTSVIEAAKHVGVEIPYYCYHKRLSIASGRAFLPAPAPRVTTVCPMPRKRIRWASICATSEMDSNERAKKTAGSCGEFL